MKKHLFSLEGVIGTILFVVTILLILFFQDKNPLITYPILAVNWIGLLLLIDYFDRKILNDSLLFSDKNRLVKIVIVAFCCGLILDIFGVFLAKLWVYPFLTLPLYLTLAPIGFTVYAIILLSLYKILKKILEPHQKISKNLSYYTEIMYCELIAGVILGFIIFRYLTELLQTQTISLLNISTPEKLEIAWWYTFVIAFSLFFIFEFLSFTQKKITLTKKLLQGNFYPLIAIFITNILVIVAIEYINMFFGLWIFSNWPLDTFRIINIPITALLIWQLQLPVFLAFWNVFLGKEELEIW